MKFNRWQACNKYTWSFNLFNAHHAQLNDLYWAYVPASQFAYRAGAASNAGDTVAAVFSLRGGQDRRMPPDLPSWKALFQDFDNWVRLCALLSSASYFDMYLQTVVLLALESDPALLHGCSKKTDGMQYVKANPNYSLATYGDGCAHGEWSARVAAFKRLFGTAPTRLENAVGDLDRIRQLRNGVGHYFGRIANVESLRAVSIPDKMERLSEAALQRSLATIAEAAEAIDAHLINHIGDFESVLYYHKNRSRLDRNDPGRALSKSLAAARFSPGLRYCRALIAYYHSI